MIGMIPSLNPNTPPFVAMWPWVSRVEKEKSDPKYQRLINVLPGQGRHQTPRPHNNPLVMSPNEVYSFVYCGDPILFACRFTALICLPIGNSSIAIRGLLSSSSNPTRCLGVGYALPVAARLDECGCRIKPQPIPSLMQGGGTESKVTNLKR
jgi:hypothetical protein